MELYEKIGQKSCILSGKTKNIKLPNLGDNLTMNLALGTGMLYGGGLVGPYSTGKQFI